MIPAFMIVSIRYKASFIRIYTEGMAFRHICVICISAIVAKVVLKLLFLPTNFAFEFVHVALLYLFDNENILTSLLYPCTIGLWVNLHISRYAFFDKTGLGREFSLLCVNNCMQYPLSMKRSDSVI